MSQIIFLWLLLFVGFSNADNTYNVSAYVSPSILLDNKFFVEVEQEVQVGFRLFDASSLNIDSTTIQYQNLQFNTNPPNILVPRVVANKDKLFFFGIDGEDSIFTSGTVMYSFDIKEKTWKVLKDVNMPAHILIHQEEQFVGPDSEGNAYLLYNSFNIMLTFNTVSLKWDEHTIQPFVPTGMNFYSWYTSTILPDGMIVYIGGKFGNYTGGFIDVQMNQVYVYDTKTNVWSTKITGGIAPGPRHYHTATLASNGRIIVYGGQDVNRKPAYPDLVILDTTTPIYSWSVPQVKNTIGPVILPSSVMVDNFMILYVGLNSSGTMKWFDKVFMLDTTTYTWYSLNTVAANETENIYSNQESPLPTLDASNASISENNDKITFIFIVILTVISSLHILLILGTSFYKWYQMRHHSKNKREIMNHPFQPTLQPTLQPTVQPTFQPVHQFSQSNTQPVT